MNTLRSIAIIPDGNRRYAKKEGISLSKAYEIGTNKAWELIGWLKRYRTINCGIFYTLSFENLSREKKELDILTSIFDKNLDLVFEKSIFKDQGIKLKFVGNLDFFPKNILKKIIEVEEYTAKFGDKIIYIALGYSGRQEIVNAVLNIAEEYKNDTFSLARLNENNFKDYLSIPVEPDLLIRTSGTKRLSGFLPYQSAYSEIYFSDKLWPEFTEKDFDIAIEDYYQRKRNFGR